MRIGIMGATGLLGRNLLFEILERNLGRLADLEVFLFDCAAPAATLEERLKAIVERDAAFYLGANATWDGSLWDEVQQCIRPVTCDPKAGDFGISGEDRSRLNEKPFDLFFCVAALADPKDPPAVGRRWKRTNVRRASRLSTLIDSLDAARVFYVDTAYACRRADEAFELGARRGALWNPSERVRLKCELSFRPFLRRRGAVAGAFTNHG